MSEMSYGSAPCWAYDFREEISFRECYDAEGILPMRDNEEMEDTA